MTMMPCLSSAKYGMDGYSGAVSFMGVKGKNFILICVAVFIVMWDIVLSTLFARSVSNVAAAATGKEAMSHPFQVCMMLVCMLATFLVVWKGPLVIKKFNNIVAPLMIIVMIMLAAILTFKIGWGTIVKAEPLMPYESNWVNFLIAVELSFGAGLSWWPEMGGLSRLCKTSRAAYWANLVGLVLAATVATAIGAAACLTIGSEDPTVWMLQLAGVGLGVLALIFIAVANVTSCATITYTMCLGLKGLKILQERKWGAVVGGFCIIVAICLVCGADWIYDHFYIMLGVTCMFYVPMTAISAVDYMILRAAAEPAGSLQQDQHIEVLVLGRRQLGRADHLHCGRPVLLGLLRSCKPDLQTAVRLLHRISWSRHPLRHRLLSGDEAGRREDRQGCISDAGECRALMVDLKKRISWGCCPLT